MANTTTPSISIETMDYLSLLPQELIHAHILPKLFTKEAARTTILSKRWRSLWTSLPYLEFYQFHFHHTISFRNFVDHTIRDHARTETDILRFKLFITHDIQVSDIDNWVRLVMSRNVREFHLHNLGREPYTWPSRNVCMANTITLLELYNCEVRCNNNNIRLPHLQTLSFEKVLIDHRSIEFFLIGCPSMNDLKVWNCYELKYLIIANHHQLKRVLKEKRPDCYSESSSFTMSREAFERNIGLSLVSMNNISGENDHKIAFFDALFEVGFNTKQAIVLESL
ncbi:hypothetical protein TanjilG_28410 [Lupinus angustifolius]|uniref:F-box/LRR-repeat protein 15/At3g58940/PEG3-like LRR domain-containing protein n=1 Tax=Lupinus angustifolius TaxID=3871 RepID=A0A1J7I0L6_LUPAN|nr:hypothetical protein TanjilG_28410 [Lupinus angustifolius]